MKIRSKHLVIFLLVVLSLTLIGCGVPQKDYDALQTQLDQAQKDYATTKAQLSTVQKDFDATKAQLSSAQKDYDTTKSKLDAAQIEIKKLQDTNAGQSETLKQTQAEVTQLENHLDAILDSELIQYYKVSYAPYNYAWDLSIALRDYFSYKEQTRPSEIATMVTINDATIENLVRMINDSALENNLKKSDVVNLVARFAQSLPHTNQDVKTPDDAYPRYPLETLIEQGGDSQDTSILTATILSVLDFEVVFLSYKAQNHLAIGVYMPSAGGYNWEYEGKRYYYLETTGSEYWRLGECPPPYVGLTPTVIPLGG